MKPLCNNKVLKSDEKPVSWMVTFGDLLTLLLCFFSALITVNGEKVNKLVEKGHVASNGTQIATNHLSRSITWLSFPVEGLEGNDFKGAVISKFEELKSGKHLGIARLFVESCWPSEATPAEWNWHQSMTQALTAHSQLIDTLGSAQASEILIRVVGQDCEVMSHREQDAVLIVGFETT